MCDGRLAVDLLWIWMVVNDAPPYSSKPQSHTWGCVPWCKREELGNWCLKSAQGIRGRLLTYKVGQTLMALVHLWRPACCSPGKKCPVCFRDSDTPVLVPIFREGRVVRCVSNNSTFPAATGLLIPLVQPQAGAGPRSRGWELHPLQRTGRRDNATFLILRAVPTLGLIVAGLLQEGGQPAVTGYHRLFLRAGSSPPFSLG